MFSTRCTDTPENTDLPKTDKENFPNNQSQAGGQHLAFFPLDRWERVLQLDHEREIMFGYRGVLGCPILRDVPGKPGMLCKTVLLGEEEGGNGLRA